MTSILSAKPELTIDYVNWRGHRATRHVIPRELVWGSTQWHTESQWLLRAYDVSREAERQFAVKDIMGWSCDGTGIISHGTGGRTLDDVLADYRETIVMRGDLPRATVERQLDIVEQLSAFELGRFLLMNRGLNGKWIDYAIEGRKQGSFKHPLEEAIVHRATVFRATQERFEIFQREVAKRVKPGMSVGAVPCGYMGELLTMEMPEGVRLVGFDLDFGSLLGACRRADEVGMSEQVHLELANAWDLGERDLDIITANGLTIYEPSDERVLEGYRELWKALKPGGTLITSCLTPPPGTAVECEWEFDAINADDLVLQEIVLWDILGVKWRNYRSTAQTEALLREAGFEEIEFHFDVGRVMPTAVAVKPR